MQSRLFAAEEEVLRESLVGSLVCIAHDDSSIPGSSRIRAFDKFKLGGAARCPEATWDTRTVHIWTFAGASAHWTE
ncbi:hypothetical protein HG530_015283 [Fusarium avenaceum]|nr:hypothetical protein HG530_015283 [Fusarium avenaceum]